MISRFLQKLGQSILTHLNKPIGNYQPFSLLTPEVMKRHLRPGDVVLVEGNRRISAIIKYLTQSTWSHSAVYVGDRLAGKEDCDGDIPCLIEADAQLGVIAVPITKYCRLNTRICRPVGLTEHDLDQVVGFLIDSLGKQYDQKNVIDLMRYLLPYPPVPIRYRRRMLSLGSGDPTRAICSTLIAQAFQSIRYPILPMITKEQIYSSEEARYLEQEILHIRHHSLFAPRDFDVSPYFRIVKPTIEENFNFRELTWG